MSTLSASDVSKVREAVMKPTLGYITEGTPVIRGYDLNQGVNFDAIIKSYRNYGFQASNLGIAIDEVNRMLQKRKEPLPEDHVVPEIETDPFVTPRTNCTIFLGYTSNMVSCGMREYIRFLVQHSLVDCIVTSAGGVEEDIIKCLAPTYLGDFYVDDRELRDNGINRIGNLNVPNENYCKFEEWLNPILDGVLDKQEKEGLSWTPSKLIEYLGNKLVNEDSILYWAARNKIPIFCPALTDGSLGDIMYFHSINRERHIKVDIVEDLKRINTIAVKASNTGMVILGGGVVKHHICNANLMRNGADYTVLINTGQDYDGSDAGARPQEAISWGKIRKNSNPVKITSDATLVFPWLVAETFAKFHFKEHSSCPF